MAKVVLPVGESIENVPLAAYTSWRVGGPAKRCYQPKDIDDLSDFLKSLPEDEPLLWLGLGSNVLVRDEGFDGTVILTQKTLNTLRLEGDTGIYAQAGVPCAKVARFGAKHDLVGGEFLAGIPGTVGGALAMNAGAFGGETWEVVTSVQTIDRHGTLRERDPQDFDIAYREVAVPEGEWFVSARFQCQPGDGAAARERIRALLQKRTDTQPTGLPSCGSVFRNPKPRFAAQLIEEAGLKGTRIGGAEVSPKHANFIINTGDATAADIEALIKHVHQTVQEKYGISLVHEVIFV